MSVSGKYLTCKINGVVIFDNYGWTVKESAVKLGRTTGRFLGFRATDQGVLGANISIKGYMDVASGQYEPVEAGTIITNLYLYRDQNDTTAAYEFPQANVFDSTQGGEIEGKVEWTSESESYGIYYCNDPT